MQRRLSQLRGIQMTKTAVTKNLANAQEVNVLEDSSKKYYGRLIVQDNGSRGRGPQGRVSNTELANHQHMQQIRGVPRPGIPYPYTGQRDGPTSDGLHHHRRPANLQKVQEEAVRVEEAARNSEFLIAGTIPVTSIYNSISCPGTGSAPTPGSSCVFPMGVRWTKDSDLPPHTCYRAGPSFIASRGVAKLQAVCSQADCVPISGGRGPPGTRTERPRGPCYLHGLPGDTGR